MIENLPCTEVKEMVLRIDCPKETLLTVAKTTNVGFWPAVEAVAERSDCPVDALRTIALNCQLGFRKAQTKAINNPNCPTDALLTLTSQGLRSKYIPMHEAVRKLRAEGWRSANYRKERKKAGFKLETPYLLFKKDGKYCIVIVK